MQMERLSFMYSHPDSSRPVSEENRLFVSAIWKVLNSPLSRFHFQLSPTFLSSNLKHLNKDLNIPANCLGYFLSLSLFCLVLQALQFSFQRRKEFFSQVLLWDSILQGQEQKRWKHFSFHLEIPILGQDGLIIIMVEKGEDYFLCVFFFSPSHWKFPSE